MRTRNSETFRRHPKAEEYSRNASRGRKVALVLLMGWLVSFIATVYLAIRFDDAEMTARFAWAAILLLFASVVVGQQTNRGEMELETYMYNLLQQINLSHEEENRVLEGAASEFEKVVRQHLICLALQVQVAEEETWRGIDSDSISDHTKKVLREALEEDVVPIREEMDYVYNLALHFRLVPEGGYGWAFDEAAKTNSKQP